MQKIPYPLFHLSRNIDNQTHTPYYLIFPYTISFFALNQLVRTTCSHQQKLSNFFKTFQKFSYLSIRNFLKVGHYQITQSN